MKVFVTGASGYIGNALVKELTSNGHSVIGLTRSDAGEEAVRAAGGEPLRGDLSDLDLLRKAALDADATVHTAFDHSFRDFAAATEEEKTVLNAIAEAYENTGKTLVMSSGALVGANAPGFNEDSTDGDPSLGPINARAGTEAVMRSWGKRGVRTIVVRLSPMMHGNKMAPFAFALAQIAAHRRAGFAAIMGDSRWPACHVEDGVRLYRLALEKAPEGFSCYHGIAEEPVQLADIAKATAVKYDLPIREIQPGEEAVKHFGFLGHIIGLDCRLDSKLTQERLGWKPQHPGLLEALKSGQYWDQVVL